jgi:hypothetical protein
MSLIKKLKTMRAIGPQKSAEVLREKFHYLINKPIPYRAPSWPKIDPHEYEILISLHTEKTQEAILDSLTEDEKLATLKQADLICQHVFDLLGSGPTQLGSDINWLQDFKSGKVWPLTPPGRCLIIDLEDDSDIKLVWELSRHQYFHTLGRAYCLTGDRRYVLEFKKQIQSWIQSNPYTMGPNWACSMDVGLRAISWLWAASLFSHAAELDEVFWHKFYSVLSAHGEYVSSNIEDWGGIRNNHYLSNGTALAVLGMSLPQHSQSDAWTKQGWDILEECMQQQILPDGASYEMSTAYHRLITELLLTPLLLARRASYEPSSYYCEHFERMFEFTLAMQRPDGGIALFGDADDGRCQIFSDYSRRNINDHRYLLSIAAVLFDREDFAYAADIFWDEALWYLGPQAKSDFESLRNSFVQEAALLQSQAFPEAGFYCLRSEDNWLFADCGPRGIPGALGVHGHHDATSFELAHKGRTLIVDSGTYVYSSDPRSHYRLKSSKAHNVLIVDNEEMGELPEGLWELGDEAQARALEWESLREGAKLRCCHHGYERFANPVKVFRDFELDAQSAKISDRLEGVGIHGLELRYHTPFFPQKTDSGVNLTCVDSKELIAEFIFEAQGEAAGEFFCEESLIGISYGVYQQAWVFGWRFSQESLPFYSALRIEG